MRRLSRRSDVLICQSADKVKNQIAQGYSLSSELPKVETSTPKVAKDGSISLEATISAVTLPNLDSATIRKSIAGKSDTAAKQYIHSLTGVNDVTITIQRSIIHKNRLPNNSQNIVVVVTNGT